MAEAGRDPQIAHRPVPGEKDDLNTLNDIRKVAFETYKINGTPSFVINGESFDGQPTWPALKAKLLDLTK
ncbi:hypothetical protein E6W36_11500 [Hankyongella ginsenosidimutans]|uniref:Thioredoxin-like fold domain-containing protein n=1 Tax=Hankyongella ginsenosidimutans TaxID=1763828 RepID=A0A4D7C9Y4_9SPHN|nr:hypothetical protein E6W36_11500 [Hankyongella ginsenosidimutans]